MELRKEIQEKRKDLRPEYMERFSFEASSCLYKFLKKKLLIDGKTPAFLCYYPLGNEVSLLPLYQELLEEGMVLYFPVTDKEKMKFYRVSSLKMFVEGHFHVMEPTERANELTDYNQELICFTPGVGFDIFGNRIGYGKGYYDRYLKKCVCCQKIGIAYPMQIVEGLEVKPWDVPMDYLLPEIMEDTHEQFD